MSAPTFVSWNQSARDKTSRIFTTPHKSNYSLSAMRGVIDSMIMIFWGKSDDVLLLRDQMEQSSLRREYWHTLGSKAVAYAQHLGMVNGAAPELEAGAMADLLCRKQHDYGHENISRFGRHGLLVRVHDKIARLNNLISRESSAKNESLCDTYVDIVGYSASGVMWERNWFHLDLRS